MREVVKGMSQAFETFSAQGNRPPARAADAHLRSIIVDRNGPQQVAPPSPGPQVVDIVGQRRFRHQLISKHQQRLVAGAKKLGPLLQPVDVVLSRPAFPDASLAAGRAGREAPAFHVHQQSRAGIAVDDEIQILDAHIPELGPSRLIDGHIAEPMPLQISLKRRFVMVAPVHAVILISGCLFVHGNLPISNFEQGISNFEVRRLKTIIPFSF